MGFETHPHRDMEIVTWVLDGSLVHEDSKGNLGYVARGAVELEDTGPLDTGDAARLTAAGGQRITATSGSAEILVWEMARA